MHRSIALDEVAAERVEVAVGRTVTDGVGARSMRFSARGRVEGEDRAVVDDRDPVAELVGLLHVVRGEEDRLPVVVQLAEDLPQGDAALRVEAGGRLVEEQDRRAVHDRPGHHEALGHAARERHHRGAGAVGEAELLEQSRSASALAASAVMPKKRPWK